MIDGASLCVDISRVTSGLGIVNDSRDWEWDEDLGMWTGGVLTISSKVAASTSSRSSCFLWSARASCAFAVPMHGATGKHSPTMAVSQVWHIV